ncbi:MAG TPA: flagellar biosynthesis protein FlhF [Candidatus Atribacteria bacterium]|nr:flagellar biosynthesis protein FlhF [Candidatus Atribacteria bacterium]
MVIKRYLVNNMTEAMTRIRYELGSNAVIVSTRRIRQRGILGLFKPQVLEVTAAVENRQDTGPALSNAGKIMNAGDSQTAEKGQTAAGLQGDEAKKADETESRLEKELKELKQLVTMLISQAGQTGEASKDYIERVINHLRDMDVDEEIIEGFSVECGNAPEANAGPEAVTRYFENILSNCIASRSMNEKVWALIGPTGVGKTTTIAKIAAQEKLYNKKSVGLITLDTYRIGAVEQLRTYAGILNIPLEIVYTKADLINALEKLGHCDLIMIDSTGRSSLNRDQLLETRDLLDVVEDKRNILAVSAATRKNDLKAIVQNYEAIGFDSIILTKMDETQYYGNIINISKYSDKPICYITTGQVVPDDIREVTREDLLDYILTGVRT